MSAALSERLVVSRLDGIRHGTLALRWAGTRRVFGGGTGPQVDVEVLDGRFFRALALGGHLGAAESYARGWWRADDLTALVRLLLRNREVLDGMERGWARLAGPFRALAYALQRNTRTGSRQNIAAHYDLGNAFFECFLDETLAYSCGIFETPEATMREASVAKFERLAARLELRADDHLLEIGTGWGGFAIHAAREYGCRVTTTTISAAQHREAVRRVADAGLAGQVTVLQQDYRDLTGTYDKLVSIEMIEAVGHQYYARFYRQCARLLAPDGLAAIQAIVIQDRFYDRARRDVDFIKRYIFPGSCIPSLGALAQAASGSDLRLVHLEDITPHYAETLRRWRRAFRDQEAAIRAQGFDDTFLRLWDLYFCYCEGGFEEGAIGDVHLLYAKPEALRFAFHRPPLPAMAR